MVVQIKNGSKRKYPIIEIFGPTIQGEGGMVGVKTMFIRFGGCDFRCSWCDSLHAVLPEEVKKNSTQMTADEIVAGLKNRLSNKRQADWITFSGGNPVLHKLDDLITLLQRIGYSISLETQGSKWADWITRCDAITISPKGPSSGYEQSIEHVAEYVTKLQKSQVALKPVIFDMADYMYARALYLRLKKKVAVFFQVGTLPDEPVEATLNRLKWLSEKVCSDNQVMDARVLPQMHVLTWGHQQGV